MFNIPEYIAIKCHKMINKSPCSSANKWSCLICLMWYVNILLVSYRWLVVPLKDFRLTYSEWDIYIYGTPLVPTFSVRSLVFTCIYVVLWLNIYVYTYVYIYIYTKPCKYMYSKWLFFANMVLCHYSIYIYHHSKNLFITSKPKPKRIVQDLHHRGTHQRSCGDGRKIPWGHGNFSDTSNGKYLWKILKENGW